MMVLLLRSFDHSETMPPSFESAKISHCVREPKSASTSTMMSVAIGCEYITDDERSHREGAHQVI